MNRFFLTTALLLSLGSAYAERDDTRVPGTNAWYWFSRDVMTDANESEIFMDEQYTSSTYLTLKCWGGGGNFRFSLSTKHKLFAQDPNNVAVDPDALYMVTYRVGSENPGTVYRLETLGYKEQIRQDAIGFLDGAANDAILTGFAKGQKIIIRIQPISKAARVQQTLTMTFLPAGFTTALNKIEYCK